MAKRKTVVIGLLGSVLDAAEGPDRMRKWRPSVALARMPELPVDRLELIAEPRTEIIARRVADDFLTLSPEAEVRVHALTFRDPWDFEDVYAALHDFVRRYRFVPEREDYLVHITTGSHVQQICLFLLTESRRIPGRLLQLAPPDKQAPDVRKAKERRDGVLPPGPHRVIDLDLSRYDAIAARFRKEHEETLSLLKSGIGTRNAAFNTLVTRLSHVALASRAPMLLLGPTGAGKSQLARRVWELMRERERIEGRFVDVNCATLRGENAMAALFGHVRGAFTGADKVREGLLRAADGGVLFLDEIGELGLDEQAMLLRAIEDKTFFPLGSDRESKSDFRLVAGTNRDLAARVSAGQFREDLLARIDVWTFRIPGLAERPEDIEPNLDYQLERAGERLGSRVTMSREARERFVAFATSREAEWRGNFRDFDAAITRMATLAKGGRITVGEVEEERERLLSHWRALRGESSSTRSEDVVGEVLGPRRAAALDRFDRAQLAEVIRACRETHTLAEAGRALFAQSRKERTSVNDGDRLRKYLARFDLDFESAHATR